MCVLKKSGIVLRDINTGWSSDQIPYEEFDHVPTSIYIPIGTSK
jgi:hypothetical protein